MKLFTTSSKTANVLKYFSIGMTLSILAVAIIVSDPVKLIVDSQLTLKTGSILYNLWLKPPLEMYISVYMFNVTNLDAFVRGIDAKLRFNEVGPYVYQEILTNNNVTFNGNSTVTYTPKRQVIFIRERSIGDPEVDEIIAPNIPYMGVVSAATSLSVVAALGVSALTRQMNSKPMLRMTVHEYLWGYEDHLVELASKFVPSFINFPRFGILERIFEEGENTVTMKLPAKKTEKKAAEKDDEELRDYALDKWNGGNTIKFWTKKYSNATNCNKIRGGYDGTLFPRNITKGETFRIYRKAFCRTMPIVYSHPGTIDGIESYHFKLDETAFDSDIADPDTSCFCPQKKCLKRGLGNITPCYYNIPLAISFPHFLNADPSLLAGVDGLSPNVTKHGSEVALQPQLGIPMMVHTRFQINLMVDEVKFNRDMHKFRNTVLPIVWLDISLNELPASVKLLLNVLFKICPYVQYGIIIVLIVAGLALVGTALFQYFCIPTAQLSSTGGIVATTYVIPSSMGNNSACNKMLAIAEKTKKKARKLQQANVRRLSLLSQQLPQGEQQEQQQLLQLEPKDNTTLLLPEFMT